MIGTCGGFETWIAPGKTPPRVIERLYTEVQKVLQMPAVKEYVLAGGSEISGLAIEATRTKIRNEIAMWAKVVKSAGIKIE